ncbi:MAG: hypothetical protein IT329_19695 [Caldilineaceae bacterium]|nr:hypothetical protein [Caldilineaceae bacterium]
MHPPCPLALPRRSAASARGAGCLLGLERGLPPGVKQAALPPADREPGRWVKAALSPHADLPV